MDAEALVTLLAIHRHGGVSPAARVLLRTQPAISRRLAQLEAEVGAPLFDRTSRGLQLNQAGRTLLPFAERAVAAIRDARMAVRALVHEGAGSLSLVVVGTLADATLTAALKTLAERRPDADVALATATSDMVSRQVRTGDADLGLRYLADPDPDLACEHLADEPLEIVCAPGHPLAGHTVGTLKELAQERWLAFPPRPDRPETHAAHAFGLFLAHGVGPIAWRPVDSLSAQKRLVEAGYGLALIARSGVEEELARGSLGTIRVAGLRPSQPVMSVTRAGAFLSPAVSELIDLLRTAYARP